MTSKEIQRLKILKISETFKFYDSEYICRNRTKKDFYEQLRSYWIKLYFKSSNS